MIALSIEPDVLDLVNYPPVPPLYEPCCSHQWSADAGFRRSVLVASIVPPEDNPVEPTRIPTPRETPQSPPEPAPKTPNNPTPREPTPPPERPTEPKRKPTEAFSTMAL
jgi:hypothetical protein